MGRLLAVAFLAVGCGGNSGAIALHLEQPAALDWTVGTNGVDGYAGTEMQGDVASEWFFVASNDQGDKSPQTFKILVPATDGAVMLKPWWLNYKDTASGIDCNSWNGTADTSRARGTVVQFDAVCTTGDVHISGVVSHP